MLKAPFKFLISYNGIHQSVHSIVFWRADRRMPKLLYFGERSLMGGISLNWTYVHDYDLFFDISLDLSARCLFCRASASI